MMEKAILENLNIFNNKFNNILIANSNNNL
jgi:hypothetical protein